MAEVFKLAIDHIHFGKFDMGGVLYHANYFHLYEEAREKMLLEVGIKYSDLVKNNFHIVVSEAKSNYIKPVLYGNKYYLNLSLIEIKSRSMSIEYNLYCENNILHNTGHTKHALVTKVGDKLNIVKFPSSLTLALSNFQI